MKSTIRIFILMLLAALTLVPQQLSAQKIGKPFLRTFTSDQYNGHNRNFDVECDGTGRIFVANFEGLLVYDGVEWRMIHTPGISRVTCLFKDDYGTIWFGGYNVLGKVEQSDSLSVRFVSDEKKASFGEIRKIFDYKNQLRFTTDEHKYYTISPDGRIVPEKINNIFSMQWNKRDDEINERLEVKALGLRFYATENLGVRVMNSDGTPLYTMTTADGLCSNNVNAIAYDGHECLWGVTDNGIFAMNTSTIYSHFDQLQGLPGQVTTILPTPQRLYVGTLQGLFTQQSDGNFKPIAEDMQACWQLVRTEGGKVLAATADGVILFDTNGTDRRLTDKHTLSVAALGDTAFIAGELDGVVRYTIDDTDVALLTGTLIDNLPSVDRFEPDGKGGLWALSLYNKTYHLSASSQHFREKENKQLSLLLSYTDGKGRYWHSEPNGMGLCCDGQPESFQRWLRPFSKLFITDIKVADGTAWIGGRFGLIRLDLNAAAHSNPPHIDAHIRKFSIDGRDINIQMSSGKHDPIGTTLYSYRLRNDGEWSRWTEDQNVNLPHQIYGYYQITVRAKDAFGQVNESETIEFRLPPPIYLRWYSLLAYLFLFLFIIFLGVRWRERSMMAEQARLEAVVEERTSELRSAQHQLLRQEREATVGKLTKGLIDRILNPMNYINNFSHLTLGLVKDLQQNLNDLNDELDDCKDDGALSDKSADEIADLMDDSTDVLSMMQTNIDKIEQHGLSTTRTLKAMEAMLKEQSGTPQPTDLCALLQQNREMLQTYHKDDIEQLGIQLVWNVPASPVTVPVVADSFSKTIMSMLGNGIYAIRRKAEKAAYAGTKPELRLTLTTASDGITLTLRDNGIGIEESIIDKVFDPFFTTKPTSEAPGVGLYLAQQTIQNLGGTLTVASTKDEYTEFTINLPK